MIAVERSPRRCWTLDLCAKPVSSRLSVRSVSLCYRFCKSNCATDTIFAIVVTVFESVFSYWRHLFAVYCQLTNVCMLINIVYISFRKIFKYFILLNLSYKTLISKDTNKNWKGRLFQLGKQYSLSITVNKYCMVLKIQLIRNIHFEN